MVFADHWQSVRDICGVEQPVRGRIDSEMWVRITACRLQFVEHFVRVFGLDEEQGLV
jgi:ribulose bisphosphate carboxylase small subunit